MKYIYKFFEGTLNVILGSFIFLMAFFLFGNIFLRYLFNSGLVWSEELSRFLFVWITFIGAIGALKDNKHLGVTSLIKKCPRPLKKFFFVLSNSIVLYILYLLIDGSIKMSILGLNNRASSTNIPLTFMWIVGVISSVSMLVIIATNIYKALFVEGAIDKLVDLSESEDEVDLEKYSGGDEQ
jgi:TRAP-type C4-dicarboxylate transport system permease small subunit